MVAGSNHTLFLSESGQVFGCGDNHCGKLGLGDTVKQRTPTEIPMPSGTKIIQVVTVHNRTLFLSESGQVFGCGGNNRGQLGLGHREDQYTPTLIANFAGRPSPSSALYEENSAPTLFGKTGRPVHGLREETNSTHSSSYPSSSSAKAGDPGK